MIEDKDKKALDDFLEHIDCLDELNKWIDNEFNVFDVLKISRTEIRHSNVLAWLLDASETHTLGDYFFSKVIRAIIANDSDGKYNKTKLCLLDYSSFKVYREYANIDILLVSEKEQTIVVIENKVGSNEHSDQLNKYRTFINEKYPNFDKMFVYLTVNGDAPSDEDNWSILTYQDILRILEDVLSQKELSVPVKLFIENYRDSLRRYVVEDKELKEICNKIYERFKDAIDLINSNADMNSFKNDIAKGIQRALKEYDSEGKIKYQGKTAFTTDEMDEIIPNYTDDIKGSWGNEYMYSNWLEIAWDKHIVIHFELSGMNLNEKQTDVAKKLIELCKPKNKNIKFVWKRLLNYKKTITDNEENVEEVACIYTKSLIDELIKKQHEIYLELKKEA